MGYEHRLEVERRQQRLDTLLKTVYAEVEASPLTLEQKANINGRIFVVDLSNPNAEQLLGKIREEIGRSAHKIDEKIQAVAVRAVKNTKQTAEVDVLPAKMKII